MDSNTLHEVAGELSAAPWLHRQLGGNPVWQYLVLLGYLIAAVLVSKLADVLLARQFKLFKKNQTTAFADKLVHLLSGPLKLTVFIILLHVGLKPMNKPAWLQEYLDHTLGILVAVAVTYATIRAADLAFEIAKNRLHDRDQRGQLQLVLVLGKATRVFIILTAVLVTADNNGYKITGVLASLGVTGLAVALAAQETLSNLLGSIVILADRPFLLGDRVKIDAFEGVVEHIGVRSTRLRTASGDVITIPNRTVAGDAVINYTKTTEQLTQTKPNPPA